jgi:hypothetical protein
MKTTYNFTPHWIGELIKDGDFCRAVRHAWREFYPDEIQPWMDYIDEHLLLCSEAYEQEKQRWNYNSLETLSDRVERLKSALLANIEWFNDNLPMGHNAGTDDVWVEKEVLNVEYINMEGMRRSQPWNGINIKVTTYDDGSTSTSKVVVRL